MSVADYNTDPDSNTSISGINIAEGCPPSGINNAIRQMMADVKTFIDSPTFSGGMIVSSGATIDSVTVTSGATISGGISADTLTVTSGATISGGMTVDGKGLVYDSGNQTVGGEKTFSNDVIIGGGAVYKTTTSSQLALRGCPSGYLDGASIGLNGKDRSTNPGAFELATGNGTAQVKLQGKPDSTLTWDGKEVITNGGAPSNANQTELFSNKTASNGAALALCSVTHPSIPGYFRIYARTSSSASKLFEGTPSGSLKWNGQTIQTSSDERLKTAFSAVPDAVLDAWGYVDWQQFKFQEAVAEKGEENCRWHAGLVAQRVKAVFEKEGLDACAYGILCHDVWGDEYDDDGNLARPAGDMWTIRYEEALAMEAAYQRRRADRAEARLADIEKRLAALEAAE